MNEDVLWYVARVSGLMAWLLAYGALICGLLIQSRSNDASSPSRLWADDACRFFGFSCVLFTAAHGASIVLSSTFEVSPGELITLRDGSAWIETGLILGMLSAWVLLAANLLRLVDSRFAAASRLRTALVAVVLVSGAVHGWLMGSDAQNVIAYAVIGVAAFVAVATAGLAFWSGDDSVSVYNETSSVMDTPVEDQTPAKSTEGNQTEPRSIWSEPTIPQWSVATRPPRQPDPQEPVSEAQEPVSEPAPNRAMMELPELKFSTTIEIHQIPGHTNGDQNGSSNGSSDGSKKSTETDESGSENGNGDSDGDQHAGELQVPKIKGARLIEGQDSA